MDSLKNIFAIPELRKRVLFTFGLLAVYRVGGHIPTPGINTQALSILTEQAGSNLFGLYDMFSGQNLSKMTVFALGVMPYISASIILQLLDGGLAVPRAPLEGRRARPPQDHAVHALRHDSAEHRAVARDRVLSREHHAASRAGCRSSTTPAGPSG